MEYLKNMPIAVLGGGAVGKTCAADMKLAGCEVRLYDAMPFAAVSLKDVDKTGILLDGVQRNKYCFERSGRAFFDLVTTDIAAAVKGAFLSAAKNDILNFRGYRFGKLLYLFDISIPVILCVNGEVCVKFACNIENIAQLITVLSRDEYAVFCIK